MVETGGATTLIRNFGIYTVGVGLTVVGALGLSSAIELPVAISAVLFVSGLAAVMVVHEYLGGPV